MTFKSAALAKAKKVDTSGDFIKKPDRRVRLILTTQIIWGASLIVLALWWGTFLLQQNEEIGTLQSQLGVPEPKIQARLDRTERMVLSESGTFVLLILIANGVLLYVFVRDSRRSKSLQAFFASVTHEFRTPLTSIKLQAEALRDIEDNPKHKPYLDRLLEDVERLDSQVQRTLELARLEGGGDLNLQVVQLKSVLQNRILKQYSEAEQKLKFDLDIPASFIMADLTALTIVFRNILDNAIKYSKALPAQVSFKGEINGPFLLIHATHRNSEFHGDADALGSLFYRGSNSQGAGVGLYLISTLMKKMGGQAEFSPKENTFTTHLSFPIETKNDGDDHGA